ncbi:MAG: HAD family hydrolase [Candidatus Omnitrophota bacterium]|nr:HAD family hydrolase [Candidatus Omnitrophota bacterium]
MSRRASISYIFIDRDGVINKDPSGWTEHSYVTDWTEFHFLPGVFKALKLLKEKGIKVIIVSNQGGVSKGFYTQEKLGKINGLMQKEIRKNGGEVKESFYCIHRSEDNCNCRKPKPGMFEMAAKKHNIDLKKTYFIGDDKRDVIAGKSAGCKTVLVLSGKSSREDVKDWPDKPDYIFKDLLEAVNGLVKGELS